MRGKKSQFFCVLLCAGLLTACRIGSDATVPWLTEGDAGRSSEPTPGYQRLTPEPIEPVTVQNPVPEETETPAEPEPDPVMSITVSTAGDVTLGNYYDQGYEGTFREMYDQQQNPAYFLENVYDIFGSDDMTLVNLEGPLTLAQERREGQTYCISGDPGYVEILKEGSVEAAGIANNHRLDYLEQGSRDTIAALDSAGIPYAYDSYTGVYETKGIRIGFVSVNEVEQGAGVEKYVHEGIDSLREDGCQLVLVS